MNKRITIIPDDGLVMIDGRGFGNLDMSSLTSDIHAVQWHGEYGEIEYKTDTQGEKPANRRIDVLDAFASVIAAWEAAKEAADNPLPPPEPTPEEIQARLTAAVQQYLDFTAKERNYDGILSLCSYATSQNARFAAEGQAGVVFRDEVWAKCYELLEMALAGQMAIPAAEALIALLPVMEWPS